MRPAPSMCSATLVVIAPDAVVGSRWIVSSRGYHDDLCSRGDGDGGLERVAQNAAQDQRSGESENESEKKRGKPRHRESGLHRTNLLFVVGDARQRRLQQALRTT